MRTIVSLLFLFVLIACSEELTVEKHIANAKEYIAVPDLPAATIELHNALQLDSNAAEARWLLGKITLDSGEILGAEKELRLAQDLGWTADDIQPAIAKTLLAQGKFDEVLALKYKHLTPDAAAYVLSSQTMAALSNNQPEQARLLVVEALSLSPQLLEPKLAEATVTVYEGRPEDALKLVEAILASSPENGEAWWLKGQALMQQGKLEDARVAFDQSIAHSKIAFADRIARAFVNLQLEDYEAARADVTELLALSPKHPTANYIHGLILIHDKKHREALDALTIAESQSGQYPYVLYLLGTGYLVENDLDLAAQYARRFVEVAPGNANGRKLLAAILMLQNKAMEAQAVLRPVLDQNAEDLQALNIMANALLLDGQVDKGMVLYARIASLQPDWRFVPLRLETELVTAREGAETEEVQAPGNAKKNSLNFPQTEILQILTLLAHKDFPAAIEAAKAYQFRDLESVAPYHVLARVYLTAGQHDEARNVLESVLKREPGDPIANQNLGQLALESGNADAARKYYTTVLDDNPNDLSTLLLLASLEASQSNASAAITLLNQATTAHPTALEPRLHLAAYYLSKQSPDKVIPLFAKLSDLQQGSPVVLELSAKAQLAMGQYAEALATTQRLVDTNPDSAQSRYLLAMAAAKTGDQERARQELLQAVEHDKKHVPSLLNLARLAISDGNRTQFQQYLATLVEEAPESPDVLRLRAVAMRDRGDVAEAVVLSHRAFAQAPTPQTVLELATYQKEAGKSAVARSTLDAWLKNHPADVAVRLMLANEMNVGEDLASANAHYLQVLSAEPDNVVALNNLAWNLRRARPELALEYARKAVKIAPNMPTLFDTLAVIESLNGNHKSALANVRHALAEVPDHPSFRYHEAIIVSALGDKAQAIASLETLLANQRVQFAERSEAEAFLRALKG